jgi:hypothetical protein
VTCHNFGPLWACDGGEKTFWPMPQRERKWCFRCRRHLKHRLFGFSQLWYGSSFFWRCRRCHEDHTGFPQ